jgi:diguanylate cyclase (GGDEF)-like protein
MFTPRILLVEADARLRGTLVELLASEGYPYRATGDFAVALESLERGEFELLLVDPEEGEREGLALMEAVRARLPSVEIVNLATSPSVEVAARALRLGAYDLLVKPIEEISRVRETLRRVSEKIRLTRQNIILLRELQSANEGLSRLGREVRTLSQELLRLHSDAKTRGDELDLSRVFEAGLTAVSRFVGGREALLLWYDPRTHVLRGEKTTNTERRLLDRLELNLDPADRARFDQLDHRHPVASLLRHYFADDALEIVPLAHGQEPLGLLVVLSTHSSPLSPHDRGLLRQLAEWLALLFEESRLYKAILDLSALDGLTGLFNHRFFQDRLAAEVARATRQGTPASLLFCDLDDFKRLNDERGHATGDRVLTAVSRLIRGVAIDEPLDPRATMRSSDITARYGGEEFVVVLPDTRAAGALVKAERIRGAVEAARIPIGGSADALAHVTISIGVAEVPRDASDKNGLIDAADRAMYEAKRLGKNRVVDFATLGKDAAARRS